MSQVYRLVATTGISVLAKHNQIGSHLFKTCDDLVTWDRSTPSPIGDPAATTTEMCARARAVRLDPDRVKAVSAEYSMLLAMRHDDENLLATGAAIQLVHTATFAGTLAARVIKPILEKDFGVSVALHEVKDLDIADKRAMRSALGGFMQKVATLLEDGEPWGTRFAPLGGYKVMTSLAYVAGAYLGYPTLYLHENNQVIHTLPAVPIEFKAALAKDLASVIRRTAPRTRSFKALSKAHQALIKRHDYLFDRIGDEVELNAFGLFLRSRPELQAALRPRIEFSRAARGAWSTEGRSHQAIRNQLDMLIGEVELEQHERRADTHHEYSWAGKGKDALRKADFCLFKGGEVRMTWRYDIEFDQLRINHIWISHDQYESDVEAGVGIDDREFETWTVANELVFS